MSSSEAFSLKIRGMIKGQQIREDSRGKFLQPEHPFSNCKGLESFYESSRFSDLRLVAETGKVFKIHKLVLAGEYLMKIPWLSMTLQESLDCFAIIN
jgi:hypothetical protein